MHFFHITKYFFLQFVSAKQFTRAIVIQRRDRALFTGGDLKRQNAKEGLQKNSGISFFLDPPPRQHPRKRKPKLRRDFLGRFLDSRFFVFLDSPAFHVAGISPMLKGGGVHSILFADPRTQTKWKATGEVARFSENKYKNTNSIFGFNTSQILHKC